MVCQVPCCGVFRFGLLLERNLGWLWFAAVSVTLLHPWPCTAEGAMGAFEGSLWESHVWRPVHGGRRTWISGFGKGNLGGRSFW